ncbi:MAG: hypothetical protein QXQ18_02230 [Candidatus Aenigmatarchaeota archaeon]
MFRARNWKIPTFWFIGALCLLFASMIAGNLGRGDYKGTASLLIFLISLILFLMGGLLWISVALAIKHVREEFI